MNPIAGTGVVGVGIILGADVVSPSAPFGWLGAVILSLLGAYTLWRSGSVKAWKETADAREGRIADLETQLADLRAELAIPERIEGVIRLMAETAERQDAAAHVRLEGALDRLETGLDARTARLERAIREVASK